MHPPPQMSGSGSQRANLIRAGVIFSAALWECIHMDLLLGLDTDLFTSRARKTAHKALFFGFHRHPRALPCYIDRRATFDPPPQRNGITCHVCGVKLLDIVPNALGVISKHLPTLSVNMRKPGTNSCRAPLDVWIRTVNGKSSCFTRQKTRFRFLNGHFLASVCAV